jgi:hypothetical protein
MKKNRRDIFLSIIVSPSLLKFAAKCYHNEQVDTAVQAGSQAEVTPNTRSGAMFDEKVFVLVLVLVLGFWERTSRARGRRGGRFSDKTMIARQLLLLLAWARRAFPVN